MVAYVILVQAWVAKSFWSWLWDWDFWLGLNNNYMLTLFIFHWSNCHIPYYSYQLQRLCPCSLFINHKMNSVDTKSNWHFSFQSMSSLRANMASYGSLSAICCRMKLTTRALSSKQWIKFNSDGCYCYIIITLHCLVDGRMWRRGCFVLWTA